MHRPALAILAFAAMAGQSFAGPLDDAGNAVDRVARTSTAAAADLRRLGDAFLRQVNGLALLCKRLDQAADARKQSAPLIARAIELGNADLAAAREDLTARQRLLRDAEAALAQARQFVAARRAAMAQVDRAERDAFEASAPFKTADGKVEAAERALATIETNSAAAMSADPTIAPLAAQAEQARKDAVALRAATPVDDAALAEAGARSIDATNRLSAATATFHQRNGAHVQAAETVRIARQLRAEVQDAFERSILVRPGVAEARLDLVEAAHGQADAERDVAAARDALARAGTAVASRRASVQVLAQLDRDATDRLDLLAADVRAARESFLACTRDLGEVAKRLTAGDKDIRAVADAIDRAAADQAKSKR